MRRRLDIHHMMKRSQDGADFDLKHLVASAAGATIRRTCPYASGRLTVTALGAGRFQFDVITRGGEGESPRRGPLTTRAGCYRRLTTLPPDTYADM